MKSITITLADVLASEKKTVESAIIAWCEGSDDTSCSATIGGPWGQEYNCTDYARRAIEEGALYFIDEADGRMCKAIQDTDYDPDEDEDENIICNDGGYFRIGDWTESSVIFLECPSIEEAIENPKAVAEMAQAIIDYHSAYPDKQSWKNLIEDIRAASEALEGIDIDGLDY
jgi:hypothetical protein